MTRSKINSKNPIIRKMKYLILAFVALISSTSIAQNSDSAQLTRKNSAQTLIESKDGNLLMAAYGEVHYNQPIALNTQNNGSLDVHRQVLLFGYKFNSKTSFITEIEIEHIKEVYLEQAFLNHQIKPAINLQAGLLLIPMGIVNEYHEPTTFNGVERPVIDNVLVPSTWREIGAGFAGNMPSVGLRYQLYAVNGPLGYSDEGNLNGSKPIRGARQKGAQVTMSHPDFSGKLTYYGIKGLDVGLAAYIGSTESSLLNNLHNDSLNQVTIADSSSVGVQMTGIDFRYQLKNFQTRGQLILLNLNNTQQYNAFTDTDLGSTAMGYYLETSYNIAGLLKRKKKQAPITPFVRYSNINTHFNVEDGQEVNPKYNRTILTYGLSYFLAQSFVLKADFQQTVDGSDNKVSTFNAGIGYWFR
jgi:hypothetical protein